MRKVKKFSVWLSISLGIVVILIAGAVFVASKLIQKDSIKEKIHTLISKKVGGDVKYESMNLYFFWPHIVIKNGEFSVPEKFSGSFDSIVVYPKILPLLYGNLELSTLRFYRPDITINLPDKTFEPKEEDKTFSFNEQKEQIINILKYLNSNEKGLDAQIEYGKLQITSSKENILSFNNVNAYISFPDDVLSYRINSHSSISESLFFKGWINTKSFDTQGDFNLSGFKPHMLLEYILPNMESNIELMLTTKAGDDSAFSELMNRHYINDLISESKINMNLNYKSQEFKVVQGNLTLTNLKLTLSKEDKEFKISGKEIDTDIYIDENKSVFTLNNAEFAYPDIKASGEHKIDRSLKKINLNLKGNDINVESSRDAVLFVAGGDRIVDLIFDIVRGGTISEITLSAGGENFKDLWQKGNFEIKGSMVDGKVFVPIGDFDLVDVSGDAVIADGKLEGTNLKAKSGNSLGSDGTFLIGLEGPIGPLNLELSVDSDASEIPDILKKFIDDKGLIYELSLIENIKGRASGKLNLGDTKKSPQTSVYVSELDITGDYKRVPEPVSIKGNKFQFVDKSIEFENLNVNIGNFASPQTTGFYRWKDEQLIKLSSKDTNVDLSILFPWLSSFEIIRPHLRHIESMVGSAFFSAIDFAGPVSESSEWEINALGNVNKIDVKLEGFGSVMTISKAEIKSSSQDMTLSNASIQIKDSIMSAGAVLKDYFRDNLKFTMDFYGDMLADEAKLFSDYFSVPEQLNILSPVSISASSLVVQKVPSPNSSTPNDSSISKTSNITKEIDLNLNIVAESLGWTDSEAVTVDETKNEVESSDRNETSVSKTSLNGKVLVKSDNFKFKGFNWDTVDAEVALLGNKIDVNVNEANLCGIATPGLLQVTSPTLKLEFEPFAQEEDLAKAIQCLFDKAGIITGDFNLVGTINSDSNIVNVINSLEGELELTSNGGRVSKYGGFARFLSGLNFGEIFRGNTNDYTDGGFPYDFITVTTDIKDGQLIIKEAAMDGPSLKIVCNGSIDLVNEKLDLQVLVIPVMAVDSVIEKIPLISTILGKDFVSIPIQVKGDFSDPKITQLPHHSIGAGLLGIIKQTLNIPVTLVKPLDSGKKKEKAQSESSDEPSPQ